MTKKRQPPGPASGVLGIRLARRFAHDPLGFTLEMVREYGPFVSLKFGPVQAYLVADPEAVHQVLASGYKHFRKEVRTKSAVMKMAGNGIIASEGDFWLRQRRMMQSGFGRQRLIGYANEIVKHTEELMEQWPDQGTLDISQAMTELSLEIICRTMFHIDVRRESQSWADAAEVLSEAVVRELGALVPIPDWVPIPSKLRKRAARRQLENSMMKVIQERKASGEDYGDMLSALLRAKDEEGDGSQMTEQQVLDECLTLLHAGYDSSAAGMAWCWYLLSRHQEIQQKAADEALRVLGSRRATLEDYDQLPFVRQVVQETLRLFPPAWMLMTRQATCNSKLLDFEIRKGSWIYLLPWATHRSEHWFQNPGQFDPDRFSPERSQEIPQHAYFPFGMGPHICIGEQLAMVEMTLVIASILKNYCLAPSPEQAEVEIEVHTAIRPKGGLLVDLSLRQKKPD